MSGISFCSPALEQPQVTDKGRGRDRRCFPASLCRWGALGQPLNHKQSCRGGSETVSRWRDMDLMLSAQMGKETEKKPARIAEILLED